MVILQSNPADRANSTVILPLVGEVSFNQDSQISIEDSETAEELIKLVPFFDFSVIEEEGENESGDEIQRKSEDDELNPQKEEDQIGEEVGGDFEKGPSSDHDIKDQLERASLTELKEYAEILTKEDESVKKSDWMKKNKSDLLAFLLEKVS